ncbi:RagB/SusD family nutrient uptake outer membrane protein [Chitinophaga sp. MM2321]|uniref:RagB/SusD family nutrient uptake outer membrane protein n=1 Tax=Chitinophaga sp. MM2321 TaxID=3137178 RepID=UPI0032D5774E
MKNIYSSFLLACVLPIALGSCTKLHEKNFTEIVSSDFNPTEGDLGALVGSAYANWRPLYGHDNGFFSVQEETSDEWVVPARPNGWVDGGIFKRMHQHTWTVDDEYAAFNWSNAYNGVTNCNRIIYQIEADIIPVQAGKEALIAELRALRASYYYTLIDNFGNIPIITKFDLPEGFLPEQSNRKEVYAFIIKELTESLPLLSEAADKSTYGRFNKWAAHALLAKMYLNATVYAGQEEWDKCIASCDAVIQSGNYLLEDNRKNIFVTNNENSKEIIFAIPYDEIYAGGFFIHMQSLHTSSYLTYNMQVMTWGGGGAVPQFINTYDHEDARLKDDWMQGQQFAANGDPLECVYGAFKGQPLVLINSVPSIDSTAEFHAFRAAKYEYKMGTLFDLSNDVPLLRYADVLMMKAECLLRKGLSGEAAELVTDIRKRSFKDNPGKAQVTGAQLLQGSSYVYGRSKNDVIAPVEGGSDVKYGRFLDELGWEFAQEARRRQDMVRFGVFTAKSWLSHQPNGSYRSLFPIPQQELNKNINLSQNTGY